MAIIRNLLSVLIFLLSGSTQLHAHSTQDYIDHSLTKIFEHPTQANFGFQKNTWAFHVKSLPALHERENEKFNLLNQDEDDDDEPTSLKKHRIVTNSQFLAPFYPETKGYLYLPKKSLSPDRHFPYYKSDRNLVFCVLRI